MTAALIRPYFKAKYTDKWASIESTFIADARFLIDHWPHPQWQPLWYGGTRFDYIYPPALRYGTAVISKTFGYWPVKAYHVYTAFFYCIGIAGVFLLIRTGTRSRRAAWLGAAAAALMSPSFLILKEFRDDAWMLLPLRLGVLVKYGEGPHMTALAFVPIALAFTWMAMEARRPAALAAAAVFSAAVASNNFYGATALAVFYPILVWSFWITRQDRRILVPALAIPVLAYGLTAFWLVPSYFKVTSENMKYVSEHGTTWSIWIAVIAAIAFALATDRWARGKPQRTWAVFTGGNVLFFSLDILGNKFFNFRIAGEPLRLVPELDLVYILGVVTVLLWMWDLPGRWPRATVIAVTLAAFATTAGYLRHAWHMFPLWPDYQNRVEYQVSEWLWKNMPEARAYPSGSVRFWYDTWHDLPQLGGGSEQGLLNGFVENAQWELNLGPNAEPGILWLQSMGVDTVYVSDKRSQEVFKDFVHPEKFESVLPVIYDDHKGNFVYRVPRRYPSRARVVETARLQSLKPPQGNVDVENMRAYVEVIERGPDSPATVARNGTDAMSVRAKLAPGQSIVVQESYDPAWQAWSGGQPIAIHKDPMGLMALDAPPGEQEIQLRFVTPLENQVGRAVTAVSLLAVLALFGLGVRARQRV
ncbi:MAG: hypothetical protein C5B51_15450 [Terriglobia bacterium]|nr:MAG: hypothetical protein C5B51_15450 [Terriglobia bacterium]